jgi:hypothetical protein
VPSLSTHETQPAERARPENWSVRGRQLGLGVLIAFTVKGICTSTVIIAALFASMDEGSTEMFPHLLAWTIACIGGFCMLGGWRLARRRDRAVPSVRAGE